MGDDTGGSGGNAGGAGGSGVPGSGGGDSGGSQGGQGATGAGAGTQGQGGSQGGSQGATGAQGETQEDRVADKVWARFRKVVGPLLGMAVEDTAEGATGAAGGGQGATGSDGQHPTPEQREDDLEQRVRAIMGDVRADQEHADQHRHIKEIVEAVPVPSSRSYKAMWG